ncbi:MAG: PhoH family protein [Candidatus Omnitrophica bacterium]|nr:PhoH family protein [Candidatus Omnitrophota bacterium]
MVLNLKLDDNHLIQQIFGKFDENQKTIEKEFGVHVYRTHEGLRIDGPEDKVNQVGELFTYLIGIVKSGRIVKKRDILYATRVAEQEKEGGLKRLNKEKIELPVKGGLVTPKTKGQIEYLEAIKKYDIVFGIGPAGTGKTYLAMAMAVNALKKGLVRRVILTRPAVEAGENLGFLPGELEQKIMPYLRPLYDALYEMLEPEMVEQYSEQGIIEIAPLAYMRGRTFNESFVILDEAQNSTPEQMKMFLTRMGFDSKTVITGDITQSDLPEGQAIGLVEAEHILKGVEEIKFVHLTGEDTVRHELVQKIIEAYERNDKNKDK